MGSMHVPFPPSRYFVAFVCVFCVILCVSVHYDKALCGWSGLPCGWAHPVAGVILTVVEENHPVAEVACPVARFMQNCVAQMTSKSTVIGSLVNWPFDCRIVAVIVAHLGSAVGLSGAMLHGTIWNR